MDKKLGSFIELSALDIKLTPMMHQYFSIKEKHRDKILFYRMGDFYEVFFEDAIETSQLLNINLTTRGKIQDYHIPMAGIPHHAASSYVHRLTLSGKKVAICEQVEDPKMAKGIVKREVVSIVSPALPFDIDKTETGKNHYIISCQFSQDQFILAAFDYTSGNFQGHDLKSFAELFEMIKQYEPSEFISHMGQFENHQQFDVLTEYLKQRNIHLTYLSDEVFTIKNTKEDLEKLIPNYKRDSLIKNNPILLNTLGSLAHYLTSTRPLEKLVHLRPFKMVNNQGLLKVNFDTLQGLEIIPRNNQEYKSSILGFMDHTRSNLGKRNLKEIFLNPSKDLQVIKDRHQLINFFIQDLRVLDQVRDIFSKVCDIERILTKLSSSKINSSDLINLSNSFNYFEPCFNLKLTKAIPKSLALTKTEINDLGDFAQHTINIFNPEIGASLDKGNLIKTGVNKKRDKLQLLAFKNSELIKELESKYRAKTEINNLKIKNNNLNGYFIEVSKSHRDKVPKTFRVTQNLVNSSRYMTDELKKLEQDTLNAKDKLYALEKEILDQSIDQLKRLSINFLKLAKLIGYLDVLQSFAYVANSEEFTEPNFGNSKKNLEIKQCWHPIIKANINQKFIKHNIHLDEKNFFGLITGPNMAGKTTVMREIAIVQFLSQIGSFVPAKSAQLSICDYLFSRLGASDDISKGQSTFMVEMSEAAEIIRHATPNSLIILDELGRGTSTYDGLAIAWSILEYLVYKTKAFTLFSTHYHELIETVETLPGAKNFTVRTIQEGNKIIFKYELIEEGATESYGINVAKLAGLPNSIVDRASKILKTFEDVHTQKKDDTCLQLNFFDDEPQALSVENNKDIELFEKTKSALGNIDINSLTPLKALNELERIKNLIQ